MQILQVKVKPNSRAAELNKQPDGTWLARVKSPPVDGKANAALIELIADHFGVAKRQITIKSGASGRLKLVEIDN